MSNRPNFDRLQSEIGTAIVYDPVPKQEGEQYRYWRGLSLARLALELSLANFSLQLDGQPPYFIEGSRQFARNVADSISIGQRTAQIDNVFPELSKFLSREMELARTKEGLRRCLPHPGIVIAHLEQTPQTIIPDSRGSQYGIKIPTGLHDIDPYSYEFIGNYFDVDLQNLIGNPQTDLMHSVEPLQHT